MDIQEIIKDQEAVAELERLSDMVRRGEPVDFFEAIAVVDYQSYLRQRPLMDKLKDGLAKFKKLFN